MIDCGMTIQDIAKEAAGSWKKESNFVWFDSPEDGDNWTIINPEHRDSTITEQSNSAAIQKALGAGEFSDDVLMGQASHWAVGWMTQICVRVYDTDGNVTPAFQELVNIQLQLQEYPILDKSDNSRREYEAALRGIEDSCSTELAYGTPDSWAKDVFSWLWEHEPREVENVDDTGAYPSSKSIDRALRALGFNASAEHKLEDV